MCLFVPSDRSGVSIGGGDRETRTVCLRGKIRPGKSVGHRRACTDEADMDIIQRISGWSNSEGNGRSVGMGPPSELWNEYIPVVEIGFQRKSMGGSREFVCLDEHLDRTLACEAGCNDGDEKRTHSVSDGIAPLAIFGQSGQCPNPFGKRLLPDHLGFRIEVQGFQCHRPGRPRCGPEMGPVEVSLDQGEIKVLDNVLGSRATIGVQEHQLDLALGRIFPSNETIQSGHDVLHALVRTGYRRTTSRSVSGRWWFGRVCNGGQTISMRV